MSRELAYLIAVSAAAFAGLVVPWLGMRALAPSLQASPLTSVNFRGRRVFLGLGLVWAIWAVALLATSTIFDAVAAAGNASYGSVEMLLFDGPLTMPLYAVPIILTLACVAFGMADDVFGTSGDKGFKGHLRALAKGRLTTGGLKLLGIGVVAAVYGWHAMTGQADGETTSTAVLFGWWVAATLVIALSANFMNLLDLRPGRALKAYVVLALGAGVLFAIEASRRYAEVAAQTGVGWTDVDTIVTVACLVLVLLGPALAVWRFDLGERGMLGDAGSNAMGAIVGYLLAGSLPLPLLAGVAVVLLALNALSERLSFSALIERIGILRYIDRLGRAEDDDSVG
jgi:hypothetical protein